MGSLGEKLDPALVTPVVADLAHDSCDSTGRIFACGGGRVAEVFIAETEGYYTSQLTVEDVAANWGTITDREGYHVPANIGEETAIFVKAFA